MGPSPREVDFEDVRIFNTKLSFVVSPKFPFEDFAKPSIFFNRNHTSAGREQFPRERPKPGPDFKNPFFRFRVRHFHDFTLNIGINEEVLASESADLETVFFKQSDLSGRHNFLVIERVQEDFE